jgi:hypothetical protein
MATRARVRRLLVLHRRFAAAQWRLVALHRRFAAAQWRLVALHRRFAAAQWRSALLGVAFGVALAGCASEDRLSLGRHDPPRATPPGAIAGSAGEAPLPAAPAGAAGTGTTIGSEPDARVAAEPAVPEPIAPPTMRGDAGVPSLPRDAAIDVAFDCEPGVYEAVLSCEVDPSMLPPGSWQPPPGGTAMSTMLAFTVQPSPNSQWLEVASGELMFDYVGFRFVAQLQGGLDCRTETFRAQIVDGQYAAPSGPFPSAPFHGVLEGRVDHSKQALLGSWWHGPPNGGPQCTGEWMARPQR